MDAIAIARFVGALLAAAGGPALLSRLLRATFPNKKERLRSEIERNADLLAKLPKGSAGYNLLLTSIEADVERLMIDLREARREPLSIGLGIVFVVMGIVAGVWAWQLGGWWQVPVWLGAVTLTLFGLVGIQQGARETIRDDKGNPLTQS